MYVVFQILFPFVPMRNEEYIFSFKSCLSQTHSNSIYLEGKTYLLGLTSSFSINDIIEVDESLPVDITPRPLVFQSFQPQWWISEVVRTSGKIL